MSDEERAALYSDLEELRVRLAATTEDNQRLRMTLQVGTVDPTDVREAVYEAVSRALDSMDLHTTLRRAVYEALGEMRPRLEEAVRNAVVEYLAHTGRSDLEAGARRAVAEHIHFHGLDPR